MRRKCDGHDRTHKGAGVWKGTKTEERTCTKVLHLVCENRSPNRDRELSLGELNGREMEARRLT